MPRALIPMLSRNMPTRTQSTKSPIRRPRMRSEERRVGKECSTRWTGDWSSDVCSSDLQCQWHDDNCAKHCVGQRPFDKVARLLPQQIQRVPGIGEDAACADPDAFEKHADKDAKHEKPDQAAEDEIGRASCRERV